MHPGDLHLRVVATDTKLLPGFALSCPLLPERKPGLKTTPGDVKQFPKVRTRSAGVRLIQRPSTLLRHVVHIILRLTSGLNRAH